MINAGKRFFLVAITRNFGFSRQIVLKCVELMIRDKSVSYLQRRLINVKRTVLKDCNQKTFFAMSFAQCKFCYTLNQQTHVALSLTEPLLHWTKLCTICTKYCIFLCFSRSDPKSKQSLFVSKLAKYSKSL